jgi:hypothetical protein
VVRGPRAFGQEMAGLVQVGLGSGRLGVTAVKRVSRASKKVKPPLQARGSLYSGLKY